MLDGISFHDLSFKKSNQVRTLKYLGKLSTANNKILNMDTFNNGYFQHGYLQHEYFHCLIILVEWSMNNPAYFGYELTQVPTALFKGKTEKADKPALARFMLDGLPNNITNYCKVCSGWRLIGTSCTMVKGCNISVMIGYSDYILVKAQLNCTWPHPTRITYTFRDYKKWTYCHLSPFSELKVDNIFVGRYGRSGKAVWRGFINWPRSFHTIAYSITTWKYTKQQVDIAAYCSKGETAMAGTLDFKIENTSQ